MKPTAKKALSEFLGVGQVRGPIKAPPTTAPGQVKTNTVKGSPRYGKTYIEVTIGGKTIHRYAADGSQDVKGDTSAFKPNTAAFNRTGKPANLTTDAKPSRTMAAQYNGTTPGTGTQNTAAVGNPLANKQDAHKALRTFLRTGMNAK